MEKQKIYFGYIEGDVLQSAANLVQYLKNDEMGDFIFCSEGQEKNHIFLDIQRIETWLNELPTQSRICSRVLIGFYVGLFLLLVGHWFWHVRFFDLLEFW